MFSPISRLSDRIRLVLEALVERSAAVAVVFVGREAVVQAGTFTATGVTYLRLIRPFGGAPTGEAAARLELRVAQLVAEGFSHLEGQGARVHMRGVGLHGALVVVHDDRSTQERVRVEAGGAVVSLHAVFGEEGPPIVPPGGSAPPSGAPAEVAVGLGRWGWSRERRPN